MFIYMNGRAANINSPVVMITDVVPSPTYSSCTLANSITLLAAGCCTSIYLKMAFLF